MLSIDIRPIHWWSRVDLEMVVGEAKNKFYDEAAIGLSFQFQRYYKTDCKTHSHAREIPTFVTNLIL